MEGETSYLELLDWFDKYLETEEIELSHFIKNNGIDKYKSALRAFKFGLKNVFLTPRSISEEDGKVHLVDIIDAKTYCDIYKKHLPFFIALDLVQVNDRSWVLMNFTYDKIFMLLKVSDQNYQRVLLKELRNAKDKAAKSMWTGKIYYKIIDSGGQNEL